MAAMAIAGSRRCCTGGLGGERQARRADLAAGGAEGSPEATEEGPLWLNDGSCIRLRPEYPNHVWSYDFVEDRTHNGRKFRMLNVIDEFTRECLAIRIDRKLNSTDVIDVLSDLFILRGVPGHVRSDNGPEFIAKAVREWIVAVGAKTAFIEPGSPWENGYCESFNSKLRDELLNGEIFYSLAEAKDHHRGMATLLQHRTPCRFIRSRILKMGSPIFIPSDFASSLLATAHPSLLDNTMTGMPRSDISKTLSQLT
jgi:transposase InsO family protein